MSLRRIGIAAFFVAAAAMAQEPPKQEPADETKMAEVIVVTASRTEQRIDEVPAAVTVMAEGVDVGEINAPPSDRVNAGASWDHGRFFLNTTIHYQSRAEWRDVRDARYWPPTVSTRSMRERECG